MDESKWVLFSASLPVREKEWMLTHTHIRALDPDFAKTSSSPPAPRPFTQRGNMDDVCFTAELGSSALTRNAKAERSQR